MSYDVGILFEDQKYVSFAFVKYKNDIKIFNQNLSMPLWFIILRSRQFGFLTAERTR
jgi:hypothetical protein